MPIGDVDPEDPVPVEALREGAADDRAECDREAGESAVDADDEPAFLGWKCGGDDCQAQRQHDRRADALDRAGGDQLGQVGAGAHTAQAAVNSAKPAVNTWRRPNRSPSAAATTMPAANAPWPHGTPTVAGEPHRGLAALPSRCSYCLHSPFTPLTALSKRRRSFYDNRGRSEHLPLAIVRCSNEWLHNGR